MAAQSRSEKVPEREGEREGGGEGGGEGGDLQQQPPLTEEGKERGRE